MDAVNKVVTAASTALWGENGSQSQQAVQQHGEEPLSGVQGKGAASDPYDAGNRDEQPDAPSTDVNTASQHPTVDEPKNAAKTTPDSATSTNATSTTTAEESKPNQAAEASNSSASTADSSNSSAEKKGSEGAEQRSMSQPEGESNSGERSTQEVAAAHDVSEEALKGPQGPAPHSAEEFEKESKGRKPAPKKEESAKSNDPNSSPSKSSEKSGHGSGSGSGGSEKSQGSGSSKGSTMSKVKEQLHKVAHPRHGNKA